MRPPSTLHRREYEVNFGDRTRLSGAERKTLVSMSVEEACAFTVYASARVVAAPAAMPFILPVVNVEWGHGGAAVSAQYGIAGRLRVPLAASMIQLEGYLVDQRTGAPPDDDVTADVAAFIARGADGETIPNGRLVVQGGAGGELARGPQHVLSVRGYNAGGGARWVMLFDTVTAPLNGATPRLAVPAPPAPASFECAPSSPRGFLAGVWWAVSSTPLTLTHDVAATVRLETELLP